MTKTNSRSPLTRQHPFANISFPIFLTVLFCLAISNSELLAQSSEDLQSQFDALESSFEERSYRMGNKNPRRANRLFREESSKRALELLRECEENDDAELAVEILNWLVKQNRTNRAYREAHQIMVESYLDQPGIGNVFGESTSVEVLKSVLEKNEDPAVQSVARYFLAMKEDDIEKAMKLLQPLSTGFDHFRYRGTSIVMLASVRLQSLKAQKQSASQLKYSLLRRKMNSMGRPGSSNSDK